MIVSVFRISQAIIKMSRMMTGAVHPIEGIFDWLSDEIEKDEKDWHLIDAIFDRVDQH